MIWEGLLLGKAGWLQEWVIGSGEWVSENLSQEEGRKDVVGFKQPSLGTCFNIHLYTIHVQTTTNTSPEQWLGDY